MLSDLDEIRDFVQKLVEISQQVQSVIESKQVPHQLLCQTIGMIEPYIPHGSAIDIDRITPQDVQKHTFFSQLDYESVSRDLFELRRYTDYLGNAALLSETTGEVLGEYTEYPDNFKEPIARHLEKVCDVFEATCNAVRTIGQYTQTNITDAQALGTTTSNTPKIDF